MAATPSSSSSSKAAVRGLVLERRRLHMTLFNFEDLAGIATKLYSPQAHMMYPGCSPAAEKSPEAIFRWFRKLGATKLGISVQEVGDDLDSERLFEWSYVRLVKSDGQVLKEGKLAAVWKKNGSSFVIDVESFTNNAEEKVPL
ncbi:uncharacterized protein LOC115923565 [Strongylocentrotus purpuratus]|uniref:SnoaL-like domain-containing protein n=1 Tax=Strongylocentrotus purpuratus TaxID=7668 RepID=A0A7M7HME9_STRPU|nr:uncharacterized protein LOC105442853 [Strongylocentrotus purpuratus]XP_030840398.1 uncharacterized protein LOC115923565 [Strongylocentrotus purpuratus]|eukprot:XP_011673773.1 PREDICTED: uncharacterized protein LOC105442853 [Strongylocentrotus purpuratus]